MYLYYMTQLARKEPYNFCQLLKLDKLKFICTSDPIMKSKLYVFIYHVACSGKTKNKYKDQGLY